MEHATASPAPPSRGYAMRKQPRQRRSRVTVDAILEAAARILVEDGYAAASTNRIAERAGVGIGSLYEYFPGKEAVFAELRRRETARWYAELRDPPALDSPKQVIRHLVGERVRFAASNPTLYAALHSEVPREAVADVESSIHDDYMSLSTNYLDANRDLLRPAADVGFVAGFLARWVSSTVHDFAMHAPAELERERLVEELVDAVARYLLKDG